MVKENEELEMRIAITNEDKEILSTALAGIYGWDFNPIAVVNNGKEGYYFICKVKTIIENLQMEIAKIYVKIQEDSRPRLLSIEGIA